MVEIYYKIVLNDKKNRKFLKENYDKIEHVLNYSDTINLDFVKYWFDDEIFKHLTDIIVSHKLWEYDNGSLFKLYDAYPYGEKSNDINSNDYNRLVQTLFFITKEIRTFKTYLWGMGDYIPLLLL